MSRVAIVVVTYESAAHLDELLSSLAAHTDLARHAVLIVDNASSDDSVAIAREHAQRHPSIVVMEQLTNRGFAGGSNVGLRRARELGATYALLLNPDTVVTPGWLDALTAVADAYPEVAAAQPLLLLHNEPTLVNSAGNAIHFCGFGFCDSYRAPVTDLDPSTAPRSIPYATGAALLLRMSALARVGLLDELLFLYHEDCDLQIRLRQAGYECVVVPAATVRHKYRADFSAAKYRWLERNRWMVLLKDWPLDVLVVAAPILVGVQIAVTVFAVRNGWARELVQAHVDVARHLPALLTARATVQRARSRNANDVAWFSGSLRFAGLDHPVVTRFANPLLSFFWAAAQRVLPSTRAAARARRERFPANV